MQILIGTKRLQKKLGDCSVSKIYRLQKAGILPPRVQLPGGRSALWDEAAVDKVLQNLAQGTSAPVKDKIGSGLAGPGRPKKASSMVAA